MHSRVCCFALILSAGLLISLCHKGMLFHCSKHFCLSLDFIPLFQHDLYIFLWKFKFAAFACFHHLLSRSYFYCSLTSLSPSCCKFFFRFFLLSKPDSVHLYQFKSRIKKLVHCLLKMYSSNFLLDARKLYSLKLYFILADSLSKHFNYQWMHNLYGWKNSLT